jgi:molybdopterin-containing oxidoreductase family iron-sulfur binding subunit
MKEMSPTPPPLDVSELRRRLAAEDEPTYWRSLEELAGTNEFREAVEREFPALMERWGDTISRRGMLKVMGASLAMLGLSGCFRKRPQGNIVPYPKAPEETVLGRPIYFATAMPFNGYGRGVLALSREGRPIKIEGNPSHPASLGATDVFMQASILDMYDPDRSRTVMQAGRTTTWGDALVALNARLSPKHKDGASVRLLTGTITSPTLLAQIEEFSNRYPGARWHQYDPIQTPDGGAKGNIFQAPVDVLYDLSHADVIVSIGSDFMFEEPGSLRYARQFADGRRVRAGQKKMNRLYVVESTMTITGSVADHRLAVAPSRLEAIARALAAKLNVTSPITGQGPTLTSAETDWINALAADLSRAAKGSTAVLAGETQSAAVQALVHSINQSLGNLGKSVLHIDRVAGQGRSLKELLNDMRGGQVDTLLIMGGNPVYDAPVDLEFGKALDEMSRQMRQGDYANLTLHLGTHYDETSFRCQWHIPRSHYLESWGDVRAFDGTASIIQPLIAPMFGSKSEWEFMETLLGRPDRMGVEIIKDHWAKTAGTDFEKWWVETLQNGVVANTTAKHRQPPALRTDIAPQSAVAAGIEVLFKPDPTVWDGAFANNAWLEELPKPFIKLTWDNAVVMNVKMAEQLGGGAGMLSEGQVVQVEYGGRVIEGPVVLLPGQPDGMITLTLGYGRTQGGSVLRDENAPRGYDAYQLRRSDAPWASGGAKLTVLDKLMPLAMTRNHHAMSVQQGMPGIKPGLKPETIAHPGLSDDDLEVNNRLIIRTATLEQFRKNSDVIKELDPHHKKPLLSLYPGWDYQHGLQWGMNIDQTTCIGCNACVIACQAENNIAVVGKTEVMRQREMHWIRIDNYFSGPIDSPTVFHQPVPCMHCENAPCEYVCPVGATTHSDEGLNEMTYNRCIGTRYCSNNCPYKVRRFNFFLYSDYESPTLKLLHNPDVTVRSRGVMEKCTYCVQRITNTRIEMETQTLRLQEEARKAPDDANRQRLMKEAEERGRQIVRTLQTACQQACPTRAIIFGDIRDPQSEVAALKREPTDYGLLTELTTKPRTTYLGRIRNPNPDLAKGVQS